ncbi:DUF5677 domain-containing protein [Fluviicola sp.]|uniref:DUF5677 domain-containing protein n=1 Tax=Fluviicola sp. TaxID=1917219 RepID=UPI003D29FC16
MLDDNLFNDYGRMIISPEPIDNYESFGIVLDSGLYISRMMHQNFKQEHLTDQRNDALILFQMVFSKGIAIRHLCSGMVYENSIDNFSLNPMFDPMSVANIVRSQFEAFSNFNNIFISPKSKDIQDFLYDAWVISGLKTRQSFVDEDTLEDHRKLAEREKKMIDKLVDRIKTNPFYLSLDSTKQDWVDERIKKRAFEFLIKDGKISTPGWRELFLNAGGKKIFRHQYSYLSLMTHPSNVSVLDFNDLYKDQGYFDRSIALMNRSKEILAFLIHDYCNYMPNGKEYFNSLPEINKIIIDAINIHFREGMEPQYDNREQFYNQLEEKLKSLRDID